MRPPGQLYEIAAPTGRADGVLRLWWKRMSNFWHLVYHYDRDDHGCDDLFLSGEALLHWWTAHRAEVHDAFTSAS
jgi:homoserine kinase type II